MPRSAAAFLLATALLALPAPAVEVAVETGELDGAKFAVARPAAWNRGILLIAPGYRGADRPLLAELDPSRFAWRTLLAEGWIVAATSYRRNGVIIADALADLDALRAHLVTAFGAPDRVLVIGDSMGGLIATLLAERDPTEPRLYAGAVAVGAALDLKEPNAAIGLSLRPRIPLLFLANRSEFEGPRRYVEAAVPRGDESLEPPALFRIDRDGHVNVSQRERLAAIRALNGWLDRGRAALPRPPPSTPFFDATIAPTPQPSQVAPHPDGRGFAARVTEVSAAHGNLVLDAQPADFATTGLGPGALFQLTAHGRSFRVLYGRDFGSVKRGEWVLMPTADGWTMLSRNQADAAATARLSVGDTVAIRRYAPPPGH